VLRAATIRPPGRQRHARQRPGRPRVPAGTAPAPDGGGRPVPTRQCRSYAFAAGTSPQTPIGLTYTLETESTESVVAKTAVPFAPGRR
jgi:hypothetical protein